MDAPLRLRAAYVPVRRDDRHLQLGIDPPRRAVLPDTADVRRLLADLGVGLCVPPPTVAARRALEVLREAGLVEPVVASPRIEVRIEGPPAWADTVRTLLASAALDRPVIHGHDAGHHRAGPPVVVLLAAGPLPRERTDPHLRLGTPHLVVEGGPDAWTVGPFVVPGTTACLRCVDAALGEEDPRRSLVIDQLAHHHPPPPTDPLLQAIALPWAARELTAYAAGDRPACWSTTYTLRRDGSPQVRTWPRHPHCGCAWDLLAPR